MIVFGILLAILVFLVIYLITVYNYLITLRNRIKNSFSQIDVQLQRRYDLIPNLVETAKSYMKFEQDTFVAVTQARSQAKQAATQAAENPANPISMQNLNTAEATLATSLGRLFALVENYPDLKANENMKQLMEELTSTENKISFARQAFNDDVMVYNTYSTQFPAVLIAQYFKFEPANHFEVANEKAKEAVKVAL